MAKIERPIHSITRSHWFFCKYYFKWYLNLNLTYIHDIIMIIETLIIFLVIILFLDKMRTITIYINFISYIALCKQLKLYQGFIRPTGYKLYLYESFKSYEFDTYFFFLSFREFVQKSDILEWISRELWPGSGVWFWPLPRWDLDMYKYDVSITSWGLYICIQLTYTAAALWPGSGGWFWPLPRCSTDWQFSSELTVPIGCLSSLLLFLCSSGLPVYKVLEKHVSNVMTVHVVNSHGWEQCFLFYSPPTK